MYLLLDHETALQGIDLSDLEGFLYDFWKHPPEMPCQGKSRRLGTMFMELKGPSTALQRYYALKGILKRCHPSMPMFSNQLSSCLNLYQKFNLF
jgi:hypothetical protein